MIKKILFVLCIILFPVRIVSAQENLRESFESFSSSVRSEFKSFSDSVNAVFVRTLQEQWESFNLEDGVERPERVEPEMQPVAPVRDILWDDEVQVSELVRTAEVTTVSFFRNRSADRYSGVRELAFLFYGTEMVVKVPDRYGTFHPAGVSETDIAAFWKKLASYYFGVIIDGCEGYRKSYGLNDWAVLEWTQTVAEALFPGNLFSERTVFSAFLMNQMGYKVRMARSGKDLFCLFASNQKIYSRKFISVGSVRYYIADSGDRTSSEIYTYRSEFSNESVPLDMHLRNSVLYGGRKSYRVVSRYSGVLGKNILIPLSVPLLSFYDHYPQVDLEVYASAFPDKRFEAAFDEVLQPVLGKIETSAGIVNFFLEFLQKDFKYKTDQEQFGHEKPFFCEESFFYEYNDCEDRVTLLSFLIRHYLGLKVILLDYGNHVAAGVCLNGTGKGDYVVWNSEKYYVCDPTYIGALMGMSMPQYRKEKARIISLD